MSNERREEIVRLLQACTAVINELTQVEPRPDLDELRRTLVKASLAVAQLLDCAS